jgi:hypothetical protein
MTSVIALRWDNSRRPYQQLHLAILISLRQSEIAARR